MQEQIMEVESRFIAWWNGYDDLQKYKEKFSFPTIKFKELKAKKGRQKVEIGFKVAREGKVVKLLLKYGNGIQNKKKKRE